ncbi:hypothetical protein O0I10_003558 [Lichtheimia ornata]|uniref:TPR-like protein n=1 Tax=Lichtheimia ornata TaxID=688661 RepID=A0AAD7V9S2_9FUNG|nr:uncharacterized protein O0I10_003558 [Lichtheimia ornata]KAJ8660512.1 hypothetical protein O0I10_003558 [Lichtheimia ornata]
MTDFALAAQALILNEKLDTTATSFSEAIASTTDDILQGQYTKVLRERSPLFTSSSSNDNEGLISTGDLTSWIHARLSTLDMDNSETRFLILATGIAALNAFVQTNWTGPLLDWSVSQVVLSSDVADKQVDDRIHQHCLGVLSVDSEPVYHLTERLGLLLIARELLLAVRKQHPQPEVALWAMRAVFLQQQLLDNPTGTLQSLLLEELAKESSGFERDSLRVRQQLDVALVESYYGLDKEACNMMQQAQKTSGFQWELTGALGRRTKFQTFDVSQLVLLAESKNDDAALKQDDKKDDKDEEDEDRVRPETVALEDDTLLDQVAFTKNEKNERDEAKRRGNLQVIDQCLLLAFCLNVKNTNPEHGLTSEEMAPYVTRVLENANNWMVHTMGLLLKTRLEAHKSRTVERSLLQLQALVDQIKVEDSSVEERLAYFYELLLPSKWDMERELAKRFVSLGVVKSALEIFERLEMWEEAIACYQMLEESHKAKDVLSRLMKDDPNSPKLWCILGDVERNPDHWRKAWDISNKRFARAMRSLGAYHYRRQEYNEAIECYQHALEINPLFEGSWYILGCAAMQVDSWDVAARAFQRVVSLDHEQAEAWNNLSSIYVQMDRKTDAFLALKQATKLKFDNWRMWQNLLVVAVDVGQFADAIWAMQRVVELRWDKVREEAVDKQVLHMLVENVVQNWKDPFDRDGARLARHVQRLLEDVILTRITGSPELWGITAKFYIWQQRYVDALEASVKGYRTVMHDASIETDQQVFDRVAQVALDTVDMYETLGEKEQDGAPVCADWRYQSRQILKSIMGKGKDVFEDTVMYDRLKERLEDLKRT